MNWTKKVGRKQVGRKLGSRIYTEIDIVMTDKSILFNPYKLMQFYEILISNLQILVVNIFTNSKYLDEKNTFDNWE